MLWKRALEEVHCISYTLFQFLLHTYKRGHAFCAPKNMVKSFLLYSFQNSLQCNLVPEHILQKRQLFFPPLMWKYYNLFDHLFCFFVAPHQTGNFCVSTPWCCAWHVLDTNSCKGKGERREGEKKVAVESSE